MKFYNELIELEREHIRLDLICDAMSVIGNGAGTSPQEHVQHSIWLMEEVLREVNEGIDNKFKTLFETMSKETEQKPTPEKYDFDSVGQVVDGWIRDSAKTEE